MTDTSIPLLGSTFDFAFGEHEAGDGDAGDHFDTGPVESLYALESVLRRYPGLHLRCSAGPEIDAVTETTDLESGLSLPGLPTHPLQPEDWWYRPVADWLARQIVTHGRVSAAAPTRYPWVLTGRLMGCGPDGEPLLADVVPVARLGGGVVSEARERYAQHFERAAAPRSITPEHE